MKSLKFSRALYDFDAFLEVERNLSPRTRQAYSYDLERFADFWILHHARNPTLDRISTEDIKTYLEHLRMDLNYKSTTMSRSIASIRVFFEFCVVQGLLEASPATHIHNPKTPKKLPVFLIESEMKRLLEAPPRTEKEAALSPGGGPRRRDYRPLGRRDFAILSVLVYTGIRLRELVSLDLTSIDFESRTIRVIGKGSKERMIPLNEPVIKAFHDWLDIRSPADPSDPAVFLNRFARRISTRGVENIVGKYVKAAGISKTKISPHKLRHTFATLLHLKGVDIVEIQALLGHSSITSTQIYTHVSSTRLKNAVKKLE